MIKWNFCHSLSLRSKSQPAMVDEALLKILCHNTVPRPYPDAAG